MHEDSNQSERKIPDRGLSKVRARDQFMQSGSCCGFANERWFIPSGTVHREIINILATMAFNPTNPPFERSKAVGSDPFSRQAVLNARIDHRWFGCSISKRKRLCFSNMFLFCSLCQNHFESKSLSEQSSLPCAALAIARQEAIPYPDAAFDQRLSDLHARQDRSSFVQPRKTGADRRRLGHEFLSRLSNGSRWPDPILRRHGSGDSAY